MSTVSIHVKGVVPKTKPRRTMHIRIMAHAAKDRRTYTFPFGPQNLNISNMPHTWNSVDRPGRAPWLIESGQQNAVLTFSLIVAHPVANDKNIDQYILALNKLRSTSDYIQIDYNIVTSGQWRLTDLSYTVTRLNVYNNPTQATFNFTFTRASNIGMAKGPTSGGVKTAPKKSPPKSTKGGDKKKKIVVYTVKKGDTLWSICQRHYDNPNKWRMVADFNHIVNPNRIQPGQRIRLP